VSAFRALKYASFTHSAIYCGLIFCALTDRETLALGWLHGWGWILMSLACLVAVRARVIPLRVALCVVILGGIGPFFGSIAFVLEERRRAVRPPAP
jgi:hypothetical protein